MAIVAAAVVPHSPLLLPSIAKQHAGLFVKTTESLTAMAADWYASRPDAVIVISPHGLPNGIDMAIHSAERLTAGFSDYGDMATTLSMVGALAVSHRLKSTAEREHLPLHLQTFDQVDYGTSVPLSFLIAAQPQLPVCSILVGTQKPDLLLRLAAALKEFVHHEKTRFLLVASCDMTRRKERRPDAHRRPTAEERTFSNAIVAVDPSQLSALTPQSSTCGYGPLLVLLSALQGTADSGTIRSFEAPLGVGLLTATFSLTT